VLSNHSKCTERFSQPTTRNLAFCQGILLGASAPGKFARSNAWKPLANCNYKLHNKPGANPWQSAVTPGKFFAGKFNSNLSP